MATVTSFTAARMLEIENTTVVDGSIVGDDLILLQRDGTPINAGNVRGAEGPQGPNADVGDVKTNIRTSLPGWLALNGQSIANADTTYAALWGWAPSTWKSGTTLNLPDMTDTILEGGGTVGAITGANTKVLVEGNMPPHTHSMPNHNHTTAAHTHSVPDHVHGMYHTHTINHGHGWAVTDTQGNHAHSIPARLDPISGSAGSLGVSNAGGTISSRDSYAAGSHAHNLYVPDMAGSSGGSPSNTGGSGGLTSGSTASGTTSNAGGGNTGSGSGVSSAFDIQQRALRLNHFIKY